MTSRSRSALVALLLLAAAVPAVIALLGDSVTVDEPEHLVAGYVQLTTGDLRLCPDQPPLGHLSTALPLLALSPALPDPASKDFIGGAGVDVGRTFLAQPGGDRLLKLARGMMVLLLLGTDLLVWLAARRLFGEEGALVSLGVAALCPTLLAHGHLVTTDLPAALTDLLVLVTAAAFLRRMSGPRLLGVAAALSAASLTKFSWPLILPPLFAVGLWAVLRKPPLELSLPTRPGPVLVSNRPARLTALLAAALVAGLFVWGAIWACYGFAYSPFRWHPGPSDRMSAPGPPPRDQSGAWDAVLSDPLGRPARGLVPAFVRWGRAHRVLPEAYLYGLALMTRHFLRPTYLHGEISAGGEPGYFPVAFLIKTPLPTLFLFAAGLTAVLAGRAPRDADPALLLGLLWFVPVYAAAAVTAPLNIGHRHLLPLYPVFAILAGAGVSWFRGRLRIVPAGLVLWLAFVTVRACPLYLGYFNELAGGSRNGWRWLVDSNADWGQDLGRLARWLRARGNPPVKLAYFGAGDPAALGIRCEMLPSTMVFARPAQLSAGLYAVSVTQLVGLYFLPASDGYWESPFRREYYESLWRRTREGRVLTDLERQNLDALRQGRLLLALKSRPPDAEIGTSILVFRLSQADLERMLRP